MSKLTNQDIIRAWKDADFRNQLSAEQRAELPENPAGVVELSSAELNEVAGGEGVTSLPCELDKIGYTDGNETFICCPSTFAPDRRTSGGKIAI